MLWKSFLQNSQITPKKADFWLVFLLVFLMVLHVQLPFKLLGNFDQLTLRLIFWAAIASLIWQKRDQLVLESDIFSSLVGAGLILTVLIRSWFATGPSILMGISPLASLLGLALLAGGFRNLRQFQRELLIVVIAVFPIDEIIDSLDRMINFSLLSAKFSTAFLWYSGFQVRRQDVTVILPTGAIRINPGCSGLHSMLTMFKLSLLFILYTPVPWLTRFWLPLAASGIAFVVNVFRLIILALIVASSNKDSFAYWHEGQGSQLFSLASMLIFGWICQHIQPLPDMDTHGKES